MFETIRQHRFAHITLSAGNSMNGDCHTISPSNLWHEHLFVYWCRDQRLHNPNRHLLSNVHPTLLSCAAGIFFLIPGFWLFFWIILKQQESNFRPTGGDDLHNFCVKNEWRILPVETWSLHLSALGLSTISWGPKLPLKRTNSKTVHKS